MHKSRNSCDKKEAGGRAAEHGIRAACWLVLAGDGPWAASTRATGRAHQLPCVWASCKEMQMHISVSNHPKPPLDGGKPHGAEADKARCVILAKK